MAHYDARMLNGLLDSYENSLLSRGENKVAVHIAFPFTKKTMPEYFNESSLAYEDIHAAAKELEKKGFLSIVWKRGKVDHIIQKVLLNEENLHAAYSYLQRIPKADYEQAQRKLLKAKKANCEEDSITYAFIGYLDERIREGKSVKEFIDLADRNGTEKLLSALLLIEENEESCYIREFSIRHFGDSKTLEGLLGVVGKVMRRFGTDFAGMDVYAILSEYGIYHTPDYVYLKGEGQILLEGGTAPVLDLPLLTQGIGISGEDIRKIRLCGKDRIHKIITIENLTTFFRWTEENSLIIYLGGYHNSVRRKLLCMLYKELPGADYLHFGDIDVGGFEIYRDLCDKTGIPFQPYHMGIEELKAYEKYAKPLTKNDKKRLESLLEKERKKQTGHVETLEYMERHGIKLEQEAIGLHG